MLNIHGDDGAYDYAARVDRIINELLRKHEISNAENHAGYESFLRTVETTLAIMRGEIPFRRREGDQR